VGQLSYPQSDIEQSQRRDVVTFHRRGVTLVEVGVFSGMLLLLTLMLSVFLANGQTYTRHTNYYSAAHREAALALSDIKGELSRATPRFLATNRDRIYFLSSKTAPSNPPIEFDVDTGGIRWQRWISYFLVVDRSQLVKAEEALVNPTSHLLISPEPTVDFAHFESLENGRTVAGGVTSFEVQQLGHGTVRCYLSTTSEGSGRTDEQHSTINAEMTIRLQDGWTP